jgi:hypothetical protein
MNIVFDFLTKRSCALCYMLWEELAVHLPCISPGAEGIDRSLRSTWYYMRKASVRSVYLNGLASEYTSRQARGIRGWRL